MALLSLTLPIALGACSGANRVVEEEPPQLVLNEPVQPPPPPPPVKEPVKERFPTPKKRPAAPLEAKPPAEAKAEARPIEPERVIGLTEAQTAELLGQPAEREDKAPARVWRYAARGCAVTVVFYPEVESLTYRVLDVEVTDRAGRSAPERTCLGEIAAARRKA